MNLYAGTLREIFRLSSSKDEKEVDLGRKIENMYGWTAEVSIWDGEDKYPKLSTMYHHIKHNCDKESWRL